MNKLSYISLLVAGMMTMSSCSDILDTPPTTTPSESIFWQSKSDFDSALTGCYQGMQQYIHTSNGRIGLVVKVRNKTGHRRIYIVCLNHIGQIDIMNSVRNQYEGEVLFLRSYCYYLLYLCYGEVPYPTEPLDLVTQNMAKGQEV